MVLEHRKDHPSRWATLESIAGKFGCTAQTSDNGTKQHERDHGLRDGLTTPEVLRMKALER